MSGAQEQAASSNPFSSPEALLRQTRTVCLGLAGTPVLFTLLAWYMIYGSPVRPHALPAFGVAWAGLWAIGLAWAVASPFVYRAMALGAPSGGTASDPQVDASSRWKGFHMRSVVICALPEVAPLIGFVITFRSERIYVVLLSSLVFYAMWAVNFPRRSLWDSWAAAVGTSVPWQSSPATESPSSVPPAQSTPTEPPVFARDMQPQGRVSDAGYQRAHPTVSSVGGQLVLAIFGLLLVGAVFFGFTAGVQPFLRWIMVAVIMGAGVIGAGWGIRHGVLPGVREGTLKPIHWFNLIGSVVLVTIGPVFAYVQWTWFNVLRE